MSIRVHKLAKELGLTSKELIKKLKALDVKVTGHMSALDDETVGIIKHELTPAREGPEKKEKPKTKERPEKKRPKEVPGEAEGEKPKEKKEPELKSVKLELPVTPKQLSVKLGVKPNQLIKHLMGKGAFVTINQNLNEETVKEAARHYGYRIERPPTIEEELLKEHKEEKGEVYGLVPRAPVVTFMGHVDHGKTSLLDFIRKAKVVEKEKGGITQHIGAYEVKLPKGEVTFLDTPGHHAFTAMRARGANATDIVVLVVAADDGIMPQTKEAIDHARAAGVSIVVAINKCDLPNISIDKVKRQLAENDLNPEDWGGKTITMPVSAKTGDGVEHLLEMLLLEAEMLELKANPNAKAHGVVIEGKLSADKGPVATVLVKNGTLKTGDVVLSGLYHGKVKAMINDRGERIQEAPPSMPVEVLGLSGVPQAGDEFYVVKDEKKARTLTALKQQEKHTVGLRGEQRVRLEDLYKRIQNGTIKELKVILKADVQGSVEAIKGSLVELSTKDVKLDIIHTGVGSINDSDIMLALVSNAIVIGFNVKVEPKAEETIKKENVEARLYDIIYEVIADMKAAMEGLLEPIVKEIFKGRAKVAQAFRVSKVGVVAGCMVVKGTIPRTGFVKLLRAKEVVYKGKIRSLKRFKDDVREVQEGFECGIALENHNDIKAGDIIEAYQIEKTARRLDSKK